MTDVHPQIQTPPLGAFVTDRGLTFRLWSSRAWSAQVVVYGDEGRLDRFPLHPTGGGLFEATVPDLHPGTRYAFDLDGQVVPDPYARWLPAGVHGPATVWEPGHHFRHRAPDLRPEELVIYELHVGTFTPEGTYRAAQARLPYLRALGVNCIELMPLSSLPGGRGWGYDGVALFAPFAPYGPPEDLQAFVDEAHGLGLVVILDTVYNHFGPDGNYLSVYSPEYFTDQHKTPWGDALNYADPHMRRLVLDSAEHWLRTYRFDGFRLDATHEIYDPGETHILAELAGHVHRLRSELGTRHFLFCEDDRNWPGLVTGYGMDGLWADDFHHQVRVLLTGEQDGYYAAYRPEVAELARCITHGWLYEGQPWPLGEPHPRGEPADELPASSFVYCIQNHDQIGNRAMGDRLQEQAGADGFLAASTLLLFLPMTPMIFQGQEWMASAPFQFFSDHAGELGEAVTRGRLEEFGHFQAFQAQGLQVPDPQAESTFVNSKLDWTEQADPDHAAVLEVYRRLLALRRHDPVLRHAGRQHLRAGAEGQLLWVERTHQNERRVLLVNFSDAPLTFKGLEGVPLETARELFRTAGEGDGPLSGRSAVLLAVQDV